MKENEEPNWGTMVEPDEMYPVTYTIDQDGKKHIGPTFIKGADMTENLIKELYNRIDLNKLLKIDELNSRLKNVIDVKDTLYYELERLSEQVHAERAEAFKENERLRKEKDDVMLVAVTTRKENERLKEEVNLLVGRVELAKESADLIRQQLQAENTHLINLLKQVFADAAIDGKRRTPLYDKIERAISK